MLENTVQILASQVSTAIFVLYVLVNISISFYMLCHDLVTVKLLKNLSNIVQQIPHSY